MPLKQCFEMKDPSVNADKFWNVKITGGDVKFEWGRIGTSGQSLVKPFPDTSSAEKAAFEKINEKARKGYKQVPC